MPQPPPDSISFARRYPVAEMYLQRAEAYEFGMRGKVLSSDSARSFIRRAAKEGHPTGQYLYGSMLLRGAGVAQDVEAGLELLDKAANQRYLLAVSLLANVYADSLDNTFTTRAGRLPFDRVRAVAYASRAANLGDGKAAVYVGKAYLYGNGAEANDSLAIAWLTLAATRNDDVNAILLLGDIYYLGISRAGVRLRQAAVWYQRAATHRYAQIEELMWGRIGLHNVEQTARRVFIAQTRLSGLMYPGEFDLKIRLY
jgi:uncharacterized protein